MRKYAIDDIVMGILSIAVPVAIVLSIGYYAAEKKEHGVEFVKVDSNLADKFMLCATRIHVLEREVDMLKSRVEDMEIYMMYGSDYEDEKCVTESQGVNSSH